MSYTSDKLKYTNEKLKLTQSETILEHLVNEKEIAAAANDFQNAAEIADKISNLNKELDELRLSVQWWDTIPSDIQSELDSQNYVRAVLLSQNQACEQEKIRRFQEYAIEQYAFDFRNAQGLAMLIKDWALSKKEVIKIIKAELPSYSGYIGPQFDINATNPTTMQEWVDNFVKQQL
jgi:excinuclease UvrABC nuclease subunit